MANREQGASSGSFKFLSFFSPWEKIKDEGKGVGLGED
jgi:hypothetical protein